MRNSCKKRISFIAIYCEKFLAEVADENFLLFYIKGSILCQLLKIGYQNNKGLFIKGYEYELILKVDNKLFRV
jgi:hypothetical protein